MFPCLVTSRELPLALRKIHFICYAQLGTFLAQEVCRLHLSCSKLRAELGLKPLFLEDQPNNTSAITVKKVQEEGQERSYERRVSYRY